MAFDKHANKWDQDPIKVKRAKVIAREIKDYVNLEKSMNVLEFGCGTGLLSEQLIDQFSTITLVDTSEGMIKELQKKIIKNKINNFFPINVDLLYNDIDRDNFDMIYTLMTLHHIIDLDKILNKFNYLLKTNGYLCIADLVKEDGSFHSHSNNFEGHNGFDKDKLSSFLSKAGFKILSYKICFNIEKEVNNKIKKYPLFLMVCKKCI